MSLFAVAKALFNPLSYMASPPDVPDRRELMEADSVGVYRPSMRVRGRGKPDSQLGFYELVPILIALWFHRV